VTPFLVHVRVVASMTVVDVLNAFFDHSALVWICATVMMLIGAGLVAHAAESNLIALVYGPFLGIGGLAGDTISRLNGFRLHDDADCNSIFTTAGGAAVSLIALMLITRILDAAFNWIVGRPVPPHERPVLPKSAAHAHTIGERS
jgi:hypothetical protein